MTTPTPGDLSARLPELPTPFGPWHATSDDEGYYTYTADQMRAYAIAALSALPAGGEPVFYALPGLIENCQAIAGVQSRHRVVLSTEPEDGYTVPFYTTPQPSAAEDYESWAKQERQREDTATRLGSAAVGAQGDEVIIGATRCYGDDNWFRELTARGATFLVPLDQQDKARHALAAPAAVGAQGEGWPTDDQLIDFAVENEFLLFCDKDEFVQIAREVLAWFGRRSAAPAAGKGVDDAMVERALSAPYGNYSVSSFIPLKSPTNARNLMRAALEAALTRQPVAGDGMVLVPREPTPAMLIPLVHRSFQDHWEAGKRLQSEQLHRSSVAGNYGYQDWMIPPKTEYEVAAGQYLAMLAAAPAATPTDGGEGKA